MWLFKTLLACIAVCSFPAYAAAKVTIDSTSLDFYTPTIQPTAYPKPHTSDHPTDFPLSKSYDETGSFGHSSAALNWYLNGSQTVFSFAAQSDIPNAPNFEVGLEANEFRFTANANEPYQITGSNSISEAFPYGDAYIELSFNDVTANNAVVFKDDLTVASIPNETAKVKIPDTGTYHVQSGSPIGSLIAGHQYLLTFKLASYSYMDDPHQSIGNITLSIGDVPEPTSVVLVAFAAMVLGVRRSR